MTEQLSLPPVGSAAAGPVSPPGTAALNERARQVAYIDAQLANPDRDPEDLKPLRARPH